MILCITHSKDFYNVDIFMDYLTKKGIPVVRFDTDLYPSEIDIQLKVGPAGKDVIVSSNDFSFNLSEVTGVWVRKIWRSSILNEVDEKYRRGAGNEIRAVLIEFIAALQEKAVMVNDFSAENKVDGNKYYQLEEAVKAGLLIPNTLVSNNFQRVQSFYEEVGGNMIAKLQKSLDFSMGKSDQFFPTTQITPEYLEQMEGTLEFCPMMFQELVPKAYELRVSYVDGECFAGKINATETIEGQVDWRNTESQGAFWEPYTLPQQEVDKINGLMRQLNLTIGAIDIICKPTGEYVFLEVNPSGEWGMLQKFLNYPIAEAIANAILKKM